jgi:hypothetical protein
VSKLFSLSLLTSDISAPNGYRASDANNAARSLNLPEVLSPVRGNRGFKSHQPDVPQHAGTNILHAIVERCMLIIMYCMHKICADTGLAVLSVRYENQRA